MSDLGRLFRLSATGLKPLENFTTAALAIAIVRDPRPIKKALQAIDCTCQENEPHPALVAVKDGLPSGTSIGADTQTTLWPVDGIGIGYLDLVLKLGNEQAPENSIWVEVKVDASESGNQLDVYGAHAARCSPGPAIITLARTQVRPHVPFLRWSDVVDAIDSIPDPHYTWLSLREFLLEERIVRPPVPTEPSNVEACIDVVVAVNRRVRERWPHGGLAWAVEGALRSALLRSREAKQDLSAEAGPILHGFAFIEGAWQWRLAFFGRSELRKGSPRSAPRSVRRRDRRSTGGVASESVSARGIGAAPPARRALLARRHRAMVRRWPSPAASRRRLELLSVGLRHKTGQSGPAGHCQTGCRRVRRPRTKLGGPQTRRPVAGMS